MDDTTHELTRSRRGGMNEEFVWRYTTRRTGRTHPQRYARPHDARKYACVNVIPRPTYASTSYAATAVQVAQGGPRAFARSTGFPLEFVPLTDPAHLHVGDTLHVRVVGRGRAVGGIAIDATGVMDSTATPGSAPVSFLADANGVAHVPLTKVGPWMLRSAFVDRRAGGAANEWDVSRSTYVFNAGARH